ncbi:hypothetical protein BH20ACT16_BH20ACT16_09450 [soil metagenome]|jgi:hypothetical protein
MTRSLPSPRRWRRVVAAALLALGALAASTAFAASLNVTASKQTGWSATCTASTVTASAEADSYVDDGGAADDNFGGIGTMTVRSGGITVLLSLVPDNARALVRFPLPASAGRCPVTLAKLRLYATAATSGRTLRAIPVDGSWVESSVTWNNQPNATGTAVGIASGSGAGYREWTVTPQVTTMYSGTNNGFLIRDSVDGGGLLADYTQTFTSRTGTAGQRPELVITYG